MTAPTVNRTPEIDLRALQCLVEQRWSLERTARETGLSRAAVAELIDDVGGRSRLPQALADARGGNMVHANNPTPFIVAPISSVHPHPGNLRQDLGDLTELTASIAARGVLQPLTVFQAAQGAFVLTDGHRRHEAASRAGLTHVQCIVKPKPGLEQLIETMLAAAMHEQLHPLDQADAFDALLRQDLTRAEIAERTGFRPAFVSDRLVLLNLPERAREKFRAGKLTTGSAIRLAKQVEKTGHGSAPTAAPRSQYLTRTHPLADDAAEACHHGDTRRLVGGVACGQCWQSTIAASALEGALHLVDDDEAAQCLARLADGHRQDRTR